MELINLEHTDFDTLFRSFEQAFSDYEVSFKKEEVRSMLKRRGYNQRLSFAAVEHGQIVSFTLNGTGTFNGLPTAYDTGTGTVKEYRGQGLARKIFRHSLPILKEAGIRQYLLEVLQNNSNAIAVYRRTNFETSGEFLCFRQSIANIKTSDITDICTIKPVELDFICNSQDFCDFQPSWQNSIDSIVRGQDELKFLGAFIDEIPAGYCVFDSETGDITQIAVKQEYRRRGIGSRLLQEATNHMKTDSVKILNVRSANQTMPAFLENNNIAPASKQFEMTLRF